MSLNFFEFSGEVRNEIYEELLSFSEPIVLKAKRPFHYDPMKVSSAAQLQAFGLPSICLSLLLVNKKMHHEASSSFYSTNCFMLENVHAEELLSFLTQIGTRNASFIRHICIDFPTFNFNLIGDTVLQQNSIRTLELIQLHCTHITKLETSLESTDATEVAIDALDRPKAATEAFALVDGYFKAISSLEEVIVNVYDEPINCNLRGKIYNRGWTICVSPRPDYSSDKFRFDDSDDDLDFSYDHDGSDWDYGPGRDLTACDKECGYCGSCDY